MKTRWNRRPEITDYWYVDCEEYREALSARLDDEEGPEDTRLPADRHLEHCADCATWYDNAAFITRRTRTTAAVAWPDVTDAVLARVPAGAQAPSTRLRVALGAVGAAQGTTALFALAGTGAYETAAWQLALAAAFGAVAARRSPPAGLVPLLGTFVGVLSWGHLTGHASGVLSYLLSAAGLVLVVLLARMTPPHRVPVPPASTVTRTRDTHDGPAGRMRLAIPLTKPTKAA
ncbi:hypothetical protein [Actinophytocola sp. KF-1]